MSECKERQNEFDDFRIPGNREGYLWNLHHGAGRREGRLSNLVDWTVFMLVVLLVGGVVAGVPQEIFKRISP